MANRYRTDMRYLESSSLFFQSNHNDAQLLEAARIETGNLDDYIRRRITEPVMGLPRSDYNDVYDFLQEASRDYDSDLSNPY